MSNQDRPCGFKPHGKCLRINPYVAGGAIYPGDLLKLADSGKVVAAETGGSEFTGAAIGVAMGYAAADGDEILVADHPDQEFFAQASTGDIAAQTDFVLNYSVVGTNPDTTFKSSRMEIKGDSGATGATLPIKAMRLYKDVQEDGFGDNTKVVCKINNHQLGSHTGTAGV